MIKIKRAYEPAERSDGYRVLVDRLWPRGIQKKKIGLDEWAKDLAPSNELRKWFAHDPDKWMEFAKRYRSELRASGQQDKLQELRAKARHETVTLVYAARDDERNNAVVLRDLLMGASRRLKGQGRTASRKAA